MKYRKKEYRNGTTDNRKYPVYCFNRISKNRKRNIKNKDDKRIARLEKRLRVD